MSHSNPLHSYDDGLGCQDLPGIAVKWARTSQENQRVHSDFKVYEIWIFNEIQGFI